MSFTQSRYLALKGPCALFGVEIGLFHLKWGIPLMLVKVASSGAGSASWANPGHSTSKTLIPMASVGLFEHYVLSPKTKKTWLGEARSALVLIEFPQIGIGVLSSALLLAKMPSFRPIVLGSDCVQALTDILFDHSYPRIAVCLVTQARHLLCGYP